MSESPVAAVSAVVLGAPDARSLAEFYRGLLGWNVVDDEPGWWFFDRLAAARDCRSRPRKRTCRRSGRPSPATSR